MGYDTAFWGAVNIDPVLSEEEARYLRKFSRTRRMLRKNGPYFVGGSGLMGQGDDPDIISHNYPPMGQPELWCHWIPNQDRNALEWDHNGSFYMSPEWMLYIIQHFLAPGAIAAGHVPGIVGGHVLSGTISAKGEREDDRWRLIVDNNKVYVEREAIRTPTQRVHPFPYKMAMHNYDQKAYVRDTFGIDILRGDLSRWITMVIPSDLETGLPTKQLHLYEHDTAAAFITMSSVPFESYYIGDDGKAHRAGTLEWTPSEEE